MDRFRRGTSPVLTPAPSAIQRWSPRHPSVGSAAPAPAGAAFARSQNRPIEIAQSCFKLFQPEKEFPVQTQELEKTLGSDRLYLIRFYRGAMLQNARTAGNTWTTAKCVRCQNLRVFLPLLQGAGCIAQLAARASIAVSIWAIWAISPGRPIPAEVASPAKEAVLISRAWS